MLDPSVRVYACGEAIIGHFAPLTTQDCSSSEPHPSKSQLVSQLCLEPVWWSALSSFAAEAHATIANVVISKDLILKYQTANVLLLASLEEQTMHHLH